MTLREKYKKEISPALKEKFGYKNQMQVPKVLKVTVNVGVGKNSKDKAYIQAVKSNVERITGQAAVLTKAKKAISGFKVREDMIVGVVATLRGNRMYDFLEKLVNITFPRVRDFRGIKTRCVDKTGNLAVGFKEHMAFGEIKVDDVENVHGLEVCITTTAKKREEGLELFKLMGFPFKKEEKIK